jgi:hypothetical protein
MNAASKYGLLICPGITAKPPVTGPAIALANATADAEGTATGGAVVATATAAAVAVGVGAVGVEITELQPANTIKSATPAAAREIPLKVPRLLTRAL